jgi:hypothetical protein
MSNLARSCLRILLVYALAGTAVGLVVYHRYPVVPAAIWSGVIAGFFLWLTLAYIWAIPAQLRDWMRMRPGTPPRDGKRVAVIGTVHAMSSSLHAPFSRTSCVAYQYKVVSFKGENPNTDYEGFALVPSYVSTEGGQVKIQAYPDLEVPEETVRGAEAKAAAREFLDSTTFLAIRKEGVKSAIAEMKKLMADDDGAMRYDHRMDPVAESLDDCRLTEKVIRAGDSVCVLGRYSEEKRALVPDPDAIMHGATIKKGEPSSFRRSALRKAFGSVIGVAVCGGAVAAAAIIFFLNVPMDAAEQMNPQRRFLWEEVKLERWIDRKIRMPLVEAGTITAPGMHMLELCEHCATGRLEANGRVVELRHASAREDDKTRVVHLAARAGERDGVTITFDRTKRPLPHHELPSTVTITLNGKSWTVPDEWLLPADVQTVFPSEVMDGRVTVVGPDDNVRVRAAFRTPVDES